jgi:hypothetical protein
MENKVPKRVNPALLKAFVQPVLAQLPQLLLGRLQEPAHSREEPGESPLRFFSCFRIRKAFTSPHPSNWNLRGNEKRKKSICFLVENLRALSEKAYLLPAENRVPPHSATNPSRLIDPFLATCYKCPFCAGASGAES